MVKSEWLEKQMQMRRSFALLRMTALLGWVQQMRRSFASLRMTAFAVGVQQFRFAQNDGACGGYGNAEALPLRQAQGQDDGVCDLRLPTEVVYGTSARVCAALACTAASLKGSANVVPVYQYGQWSM